MSPDCRERERELNLLVGGMKSEPRLADRPSAIVHGALTQCGTINSRRCFPDGRRHRGTKVSKLKQFDQNHLESFLIMGTLLFFVSFRFRQSAKIHLIPAGRLPLHVPPGIPQPRSLARMPFLPTLSGHNTPSPAELARLGRRAATTTSSNERATSYTSTVLAATGRSTVWPLRLAWDVEKYAKHVRLLL